MHRVLLPFEFFEPTTVGEVVDLVDGDTSRVLAGGVDLVLKMRLREIVPERVVSLQKVPGLDHVEANGSGLTFGALATLRQIERFQVVEEEWPLLAEAIRSIVSVQTKTMGTAVGNLCVGTPASDVAPALYALGAIVRIAAAGAAWTGAAGAGAVREIPIDEFFIDVGKTAVGPHEVVTEVHVPRVPARVCGGLHEALQDRRRHRQDKRGRPGDRVRRPVRGREDRSRFGSPDPAEGHRGREAARRHGSGGAGDREGGGCGRRGGRADIRRPLHR